MTFYLGITVTLLALSTLSDAQSGGLPDWIEDLIPPLACLGGDGTPLRCDPGDVLGSTSTRTVNETLESVLWSDAVSDKKVALGLSLLQDKDLINPIWYVHDGEIHTVPPFELSARKTLLLLFTRGERNSGVAGVLSYDIVDTDYKLAIMYHISDSEGMWYNIKCYPVDFSTDENLYDQMLESAGAWQPTEDWSEFQVREEYGIQMEITMSPVERSSEMMVRVDTRNYNPDLGPHIALSCEYRDQNGYDDYYCKKECLVPIGECFTEIRCQSVENCSSGYACSQGC